MSIEPNKKALPGLLRNKKAPECRGFDKFSVFVAECDPTFCQVVGSHFNVDFVADHDTDAEFAHFSGRMSQNFHSVFQFDPKHGVRQRFQHGAFELDHIFFGQKCSFKQVVVKQQR